MSATLNKTLYLHIGLHKTGSTALQIFLDANAARLQQQDVHYLPFQTGSFLGGTCGNGQQLFLAVRQNNTLAMQKFAAAVHASPCSRVLVSCEMFDLLTQEEIDRLRSHLPFDCRILVYLRRQDHLTASMVNQLIAYNAKTDFRHDVRHIVESVLRFAEAFGKDALHVRIYEKQQFVGGSIFSDLLNVFGIVLDENFSIPPQANPSMSRDFLELKRLCNELPSSLHLSREVVYPVLMQLSEQSARTKRAEQPAHSTPCTDLLSPAERIAVLDEFSAFNTCIAKTFLGREDGRLFLEPAPAPDAPWQPYPGVQIEALAKAMFAFTLEQASQHKEQLCMYLLNHKRLAVWGIGERYHDYVAPLLRNFSPEAETVCLVDDNPVLHGSLVGGVPVVSPCALATQQIDAVVIATLHVDTIRAHLQKLGIRLPAYPL